MRKVIIVLAGILAVALVGCSAMMDAVTPCVIEPGIIDYSGIDDASQFLPFTTLWDAERIDRAADHCHLVNQTSIARKIEDDTIRYDFLKKINTLNIANARQLEESIFSAESPVGLGLSMLLGGTFGALAIKRPGDVSEKETKKQEQIEQA